MQFNDRLRNWQSHSSALDDHALVPSTIEFLENHLLFHLVYSGTVIRDTCDYVRIAQFGSDANRSIWRGVFTSIVQQVHYHLSDPFKIHSHWRKILRNG